ncbi:hypothetical protein PRZ48_013359 [Zasmidium cellare]|uniref:FAD-binding PCMH-type domain-containing protein n=1 Tax=Zasmidium cellare TaxID=395010 RepID=A0ABR0E0U8_ZASCE|nr:hypothetical protein PRZ48_013359 [Zasmidium cellare]
MTSNDLVTQAKAFFKDHTHIPFFTPSSSDYDPIRKSYILNTGIIPLGIARPQSATDVASIVKLCTTHSIPFTVRSGGHDLFGRCFAPDALAIDMRDLKSVTVNEKTLTATIGGGIVVNDLAKALAEKHLAAPMGSIGSVGFVGWASHGGYGQLGTNYGLGVDSIVGATVVNAEGKLVKADEEMLIGIKGGGGCLGVIAELEIKVAKLEKTLAGAILYESSNLTKTISDFYSGYQALDQAGNLPSPLGIQSSVANIPGMGKLFLVGFLWSSPDFDQGWRVLDQLKSLATAIHVDVKEQTIPEWQAATDALVPHATYGRDTSVNIHSFTSDVLDVVGKHVTQMPEDHATLFSIHELRAKSYSCSDSLTSSSVFPNRTPHLVLELIASSSTPEGTKVAWDWASAFKRELEEVARKENVLLERSYVSLTPPEIVDFGVVYGDQWGVLKSLKKKYDPGNVFDGAMVKFKEEDLK